jgi:hypothetical protein
MIITKEKLETLIKELPDTVDIEDVMYRLYLLQKIEAGDAAIKAGNTLTHEETLTRLSKKWQN